METVDVGVVTYNTAELTASGLRRLLDSEQGADVRVLVHDNASIDGTAAKLAADVPEADVVAGADNLGFAGGMNRLLERSDARWFLALNSDAWPDPGAIGRLLETARSSPRAAAIAPRLLRPDGELEHSTHPFPSLRVAAAMALGGPRVLGQRRARQWLVEGAWLHDERRTVDWAVGAALLMRRDAVDAVGGFDERFFMYAEDLEWCWRAHNGGWTIVFEPDAVVRHVGNASGRQNYASRRTLAYLTNTYRFYRREHGFAATTAYRMLNLVGALRMYGVAKATGRRDIAAYWRSQLGGHVARTAGVDGPPAAAA